MAAEEGRVITIALDQTQQSRYCFAWTISNLYKNGDKMYLIHVSERSPVSSLSGVGADIMAAHEAEKHAAFKMLSTYAEYCASNNIACEAKHLLKGYEHDVLCDVDGTTSNMPASGAGNIRSALKSITTNTQSCALVLGTHKRGIAERLLLGDNTETILHHVRVPVVIVKRPYQVSLDHTTKRRIGVCVDFSKEAQTAFDWVADDFYRNDDMVFIIHVSTGKYMGGGEGDIASGDELMDNYSGICARKNMDYHTVHSRSPKDLAGAMVTLSHSLNLDCLVVGCRGRGAVKRALFGSFSDAVVRDCMCNVVVVKS